jgi:hypothetical protein
MAHVGTVFQSLAVHNEHSVVRAEGVWASMRRLADQLALTPSSLS